MTVPKSLIEAIEAEDVGGVFRGALLSAHSTWRIGGPADVLVEPGSLAQLVKLVEMIRDAGLPLVVVGEGSNLLFDDAGLRCVVLKIGERLSRCEINGSTVRAQAGVSVPKLARAAGEAGLTGLEHVAGIPGTLGGLVLMNGGSLRRSISDVVSSVQVVGRDGLFQTLQKRDCGFSYRRSIFQTGSAIVTAVDLVCTPGDRATIITDMDAILAARAAKFPHELPNCGSVFTSLEELHKRWGPPGKIIEDSGLKGRRVGDAEVSPMHANFIVNLGSARATDVRRLVAHVRDVVHQRIGWWLDCEVRYVRSDGHIAPLHKTL